MLPHPSWLDNEFWVFDRAWNWVGCSSSSYFLSFFFLSVSGAFSLRSCCFHARIHTRRRKLFSMHVLCLSVSLSLSLSLCFCLSQLSLGLNFLPPPHLFKHENKKKKKSCLSISSSNCSSTKTLLSLTIYIPAHH